MRKARNQAPEIFDEKKKKKIRIINVYYYIYNIYEYIALSTSWRFYANLIFFFFSFSVKAPIIPRPLKRKRPVLVATKDDILNGSSIFNLEHIVRYNFSVSNTQCFTRILPHSLSHSLSLKRKRIRVKPARRADRRSRIYDCDWFFRRHGASLWTHNKKAQKAEISWTRRNTNARACACLCVCVYIWRFAFRLTQVIFFLPSLSRALSPLSSLLTLLSQFFFFSLSNCVKSDSMSLSLSVAFYEFRFICTKRKRKKKKSKWIFWLDWTWLGLYSKGKQPATQPGGNRTNRTSCVVLCAKKFIRFVDRKNEKRKFIENRMFNFYFKSCRIAARWTVRLRNSCVSRIVRWWRVEETKEQTTECTYLNMIVL